MTSIAVRLLLLLLVGYQAWSADYFAYIGTFTDQKSKGIYAWRFHPATGQLTPVGLVAETASPSFLAVHPNQRFLYAVNEVSEYHGQKAGSVSAFSIDRATGRLTLLNTVSSGGPGPCHLTLDRKGQCLLAANYAGGSVAAFPVRTDGRLGEASAFFQHSGKVALPERQGGPHAHCAMVSPDSRFALVADLGLDQVLVYRLNAARALLQPSDPPFTKVRAGAGPRHLVFHPNGRLVYLINEIQSSITSFSYDAAGGGLRELQTVSTLPQDFRGTNNTAEIAIHPSGKFLYGSNRGHDSIAVFAVDEAGKLELVQHVSTQGKTPRNFAMDPTGVFLLAANQNSDNVVEFRIDPVSGRLAATGVVIEAPSPVCVTFVPVK
ncbi:MAG TPA: lactonase family protein [Bryobacteraceae bacterium]|nr:lactonase family protein [Bryobacteraceae bacterium]